MRALGWLIAIVLGLGVAALIVVMVWLPRDGDALALANERATRLSAFRRGAPLPGAGTVVETLETRLAGGGFKLGAPIFVRIYKRSFEFEVWVQRGGSFALFATYPICYFSGNLGPKLRTGDWQSPEGVYQIKARQLNPNSRWHRAFNLGFPNGYDQSFGRTGSFLMVHGGCSSVGCYAITNAAVDDVYALAQAALGGGQVSFQVHALPFRMTAEALAERRDNKNAAFWNDLKTVSDAFDATHVPPEVAVCDGHYRVAGIAGRGRNATSETACRKL